MPMPDPIQSTTEAQNNTNTETPKVPEAVQQRFDELTGTIHEMRRQAEDNNRLQQELIAQNAALNFKLTQAPTTQPAPQLPEGMDQSMAQYMANLVAENMRQNNMILEQKIGQMLGGIRQSQQQTEFQQATAGIDPAIVREAAKLQAAWTKAGLTGWTAQDAVIYAEGQAARQARSSQSRVRPNGDSADASTQAGAGAPNPVVNRSLPPAKSDAELRSMSLAQQEAYWASRVGDSELNY